MIDQTISHYRIVGMIGAGGMGEVYRAHDPRLDRDVALKVLPPAVCNDPKRLGRFEREARAAAALDHPNILAIHDVGRSDGVPYIVTELLEGSSLKDRLSDGDVTRRTAVQYAVQVAEGLAAAHARGIVHRDLKPGNLFVTRDGHVKILDFGLAKLIQETPFSNSATTQTPPSFKTDEGVVVGTIGYMSPEQLNGATADKRSDIFSFGVVLYEMLAGKRPFGGDSRARLTAAILRDDPAPLDKLKPPVSQPLERVVGRCLEKRPEDRFESAHDLAIALQAVDEAADRTPSTIRRRTRRFGFWAVAAVAALITVAVAMLAVSTLLAPPPLPEFMRVAVLPFDAEGDDPDQRLFAHGLSETITDGLGLFEEKARGRFWVVTSSTASKWSDISRENLHRTFNVNLVIEGQLRLADDRLRLVLAVVDAETGKRLRTATLEDHVSNLSCLQRDPVLKIAEMLGFTADERSIERIDELTTNVPIACENYLRGRGLLAGFTDRKDLERTAALARKAVEADPLYAPAHVALALACRRVFELEREPAWLNEGLEHATRAVELMDPPAEAYIALAGLNEASGDHEQALQALERAVDSAPRHAEGRLRLAAAYQRLQQVDLAEAAYQQAINLRPSYWLGHELFGVFLIGQGRLDAAANQFRRVCELAPKSLIGPNNLGGVYYYQERRDEAREMFERSLEIEPNPDAYSNLGTLAFEASRFGDAIANFEQATDLVTGDYQLWGHLAAAYHWGGLPEAAEHAYRRAIEVGEPGLVDWPENDYLLVDLATYHAFLGEHERGLDLLRRVTEKKPQDHVLMSCIAEAFEDLGRREDAIEWIGAALANGLEPGWIERRPGLRDLSADARVQELLGADRDLS